MYCRALDSGVFRDPQVLQELARRFVSVKIDKDTKRGAELYEKYAKAYGNALPLILVLDPDDLDDPSHGFPAAGMDRAALLKELEGL